MKYALSFFAIIFATGCTDAERSGLSAYGDSARVICHSGGKPIYDGCSTGIIHNSQNSDGYYFRDMATQRLVEISGECFIDYGAPCPTASEQIRPTVR